MSRKFIYEAIALAGAAAWFSIRGMVVLFPGAPMSVVAMALAMEAAKLDRRMARPALARDRMASARRPGHARGRPCRHQRRGRLCPARRRACGRARGGYIGPGNAG